MSTSIEANSSLFDYFHVRIRDARDGLGVDVSEDTGLYLTTLLVGRARADAPRPTETTLVELHARAVKAPPTEQARTYRELGDRALYLLGYFEESLSRKIVSTRYYGEMGAAAYARVDEVFKLWFANAFDRVFEELSEGFGDCVRIIKQVRTSADDEPDMLMRLYQQWVETGSELAKERLRSRGVVVGPRAGSEE